MAKPVAVLAHEWVSLEHAIKQVGKSERSIQRLAAAGDLRWKLDDGTRQRLYHAGDLERIKEQGIQAGREEPQRALAPRASAPLALAPDVISLVRDIAARITAPPSLAPSEKLWLNLEEAQTYAGLSRNRLLGLCREGKLTAMKDGGWKIRRASLEAFEG
jgi:hypothetical protein